MERGRSAGKVSALVSSPGVPVSFTREQPAADLAPRPPVSRAAPGQPRSLLSADATALPGVVIQGDSCWRPRASGAPLGGEQQRALLAGATWAEEPGRQWLDAGALRDCI